MKTFANFINQILEKQQELNLGPDEECLFRGHSDTSYKLIPNIFRGKSYSLKSEESIFYEFRSKAMEIHDRKFSDWDILFHMQHYGCKTRILDWTDNLGTALYFALCSYQKAGSRKLLCSIHLPLMRTAPSIEISMIRII